MRPIQVLAALMLVLSPLPSAHATAPGEMSGPGAADDARPPQTLTLGACIQAAYERHPELRGAHVAVERADDEARAVRGGFLPTLTVEGNVLVWDDEMVIEMGGGGTPPTFPGPGAGQLPESGFDQYVADSLGGMGSLLTAMATPAPTKLRDQITWGVTVRATQALTPLYQVFEGHRARRAQASGARVHVRTVRQDVALRVATGYFAALQADAYVTIAGSAVEQLAAHLEQVTAFFEQGVVGRNDVLKVEVELANARRQLVEALAGRAIARASLAVEMGRSAREPVIPAPQPPADDVSPTEVSLAEAVSAARRERSELGELEHGHEAAEHAAKASWGGLIPTVALVAQYDHTGGQGAFTLEDTFFAGLMLSWDVWDWGRTVYEAKAADGRVEELELQRERVLQLVELDATAKRIRVQSAADGFRLARVAIVQAEEALRVERERFAMRASTTTDLLDAEATLTRARAAHANAWYAWLLARVELERAMGRTPAAGEPTP